MSHLKAIADIHRRVLAGLPLTRAEQQWVLDLAKEKGLHLPPHILAAAQQKGYKT